MNHTLLLQIRRAIVKSPRQVDMQSYGYISDPTTETARACIAGWAIRLHDEVKFRDEIHDPFKVADWGSYAQDLMELTNWNAKLLFHKRCWPPELRDCLTRFTVEGMEVQYADVVIARIDEFIAMTPGFHATRARAARQRYEAAKISLRIL